MKPEKLLKEGIKTLQKNDEDISRLIAPRYEKVISLLDSYIKEIELFNSAYGLVGTDNTNEIVIRHILDSLAPLGIILRLLREICASVPLCENPNLKIADAGSGAGLPGIPLAIALPDCDFTLIERMGRRAGFLCNTCAILGTANINIEEKELEKIENRLFNLVTFRAFLPLEPKLLKTLYKIRAPGGIIAAYKGKREKIDMEMSPLRNICEKWETIPYSVPFLEEERHLLVI